MEQSTAQFGDARRPVPVLRLVLGSLAATAGLFLLGTVLGSTSASAEEPAPTGPGLLGGITSVVGSVDNTLTSVVDTTTSTLDAVISPVTAALPAPVSDVVDSVVTPTTDAVADVGGSDVVSQVVAPVASAADTIVSAVPGADQILGTAPVSAITAPITGTVDGTLGSVTGTVSTVLRPAVSTPPIVSPPIIDPAAPGGDQIGTPGDNASDTATAAVDATSAALAQLTSSAADARQFFSLRDGTAGIAENSHRSGSRSLEQIGAGVPGSDPGSPGPAHNQPDPALALTPASSGGSSSSSAGGPSGASASADVTSGAAFFCQAAEIGGLPGSDVLPSSPAADHDLSPD